MATLPLEKRLKKKVHRTTAKSQDLLADAIYDHFPNAVIHGGTAIWRCCGGSRFSEDIDVYLPTKFKESEETGRFVSSLKQLGFEVVKFKETSNSIYSKFSHSGAIVRFEAVFKNMRGFISRPFELSDGTFITVYTLSVEDLVGEKVAAYRGRRKVRDLYDIYFLLNLVQDKKGVSDALESLLKGFKPPADAGELKALIISGAVPRVEDMLEEVRRWAK